MTTKRITLTFISDAGHGFLRVPHSLIVELGLQDKLDKYNTMNASYVYLEEDCEAGKLLDAAKAAGIQVILKETYAERAACRNYGVYDPAFLGGLKAGDFIAEDSGFQYRVVREDSHWYLVEAVVSNYLCRVSKNTFSNFHRVIVTTDNPTRLIVSNRTYTLV